MKVISWKVLEDTENSEAEKLADTEDVLKVIDDRVVSENKLSNDIVMESDPRMFKGDKRVKVICS